MRVFHSGKLSSHLNVFVASNIAMLLFILGESHELCRHIKYILYILSFLSFKVTFMLQNLQ